MPVNWPANKILTLTNSSDKYAPAFFRQQAVFRLKYPIFPILSRTNDEARALLTGKRGNHRAGFLKEENFLWCGAQKYLTINGAVHISLSSEEFGVTQTKDLDHVQVIRRNAGRRQTGL